MGIVLADITVSVLVRDAAYLMPTCSWERVVWKLFVGWLWAGTETAYEEGRPWENRAKESPQEDRGEASENEVTKAES